MNHTPQSKTNEARGRCQDRSPLARGCEAPSSCTDGSMALPAMLCLHVFPQRPHDAFTICNLMILGVGRDLNPRLPTPTGSLSHTCQIQSARFRPCPLPQVPAVPRPPRPSSALPPGVPSTHCPQCSTTDLEFKSHHITPTPKPSMAPTARIRTKPKLHTAERSPMKTWSLLTPPCPSGI